MLSGDGPAISELIGMRNPGNAITPCRFCRITSTRSPLNGHYYCPHTSLQRAGFHDLRLDLRQDIEDVCMLGEAESIEHGINRKSILLELPSLHFPDSFPIDMMHAVPLNILKMLWGIWKGKRLAVDDRKKHHLHNISLPSDYLFTKQTERILNRTLKEARTNTPASLGFMPQSFNDFNNMKSADWQDVLEHTLVPLLYEHIPDNCHENLCHLYEVWVRSTAQSIRTSDITSLEHEIHAFISTFEDTYYRDDPNRLQACVINTHYLMHLADCIRKNGPACYWWSYPLERYCFETKHHAKSRSHIDVNVANAMYRMDHIFHIWLQENLDPTRPHPDTPDLRHYPELNGLITRMVDRCGYLLGDQLRRRLARMVHMPQLDHHQIFYYRRCKPNAKLSYGSETSQYSTPHNRRNHFICYSMPGIDGCHFGSVTCYLSTYDPVEQRQRQFASVQRWNGAAEDAVVQQITYANENGRRDLVETSDILGLIGVLKEWDDNRAGRLTRLIVGALPHVRAHGIA